MYTIVTGASKGIGRAVAELFASNGHNLLLCSRREAALYKAMDELLTRYPGITIKAKPADLSDTNEAINFGNWCLSQGLPVILVNNAGSFEPGNVFDEPAGTLEQQLSTNLLSAYHLTRTVVPAMIRNKSGHIFNMCSIASLDAYPNGGAYSISKFALYGFSKNLREEMKPYGIKVTHVLPGAIMTDSWGDFDNSSKRIPEAEDLARMIVAASQLSSQACVEELVIRPQLGDL